MSLAKFKKNWWSNHSITVLGIIGGIAQSWILIDWKNFDMDKEYPVLILSAITVIVGIKIKTKPNETV